MSSERRSPAPDRDRPGAPPPIARPEAPEGPDLGDNPEAAPGHYGPAYGDPTRHLGGTDEAQGGRPAASPRPADDRAGGPAPGQSPSEPASAGGPRDAGSPGIAPD
jgi:hypothetical protein